MIRESSGGPFAGGSLDRVGSLVLLSVDPVRLCVTAGMRRPGLQREMSFCFPGGDKTEQIARVENCGQPRQICPNGCAIRTGLRSRYSSVVSPDQKTPKVANVVPIRFQPLVEPCPSLYRSSIDAVRTPNARLILLRIEESGPPSKSTRRRAASSCRAGRERLRGGYPQ